MPTLFGSLSVVSPFEGGAVVRVKGQNNFGQATVLVPKEWLLIDIYKPLKVTD
jgi:hypothetical protein